MCLVPRRLGSPCSHVCFAAKSKKQKAAESGAKIVDKAKRKALRAAEKKDDE